MQDICKATGIKTLQLDLLLSKPRDTIHQGWRRPFLSSRHPHNDQAVILGIHVHMRGHRHATQAVWAISAGLRTDMTRMLPHTRRRASKPLRVCEGQSWLCLGASRQVGGYGLLIVRPLAKNGRTGLATSDHEKKSAGTILARLGERPTTAALRTLCSDTQRYIRAVFIGNANLIQQKEWMISELFGGR